MAGSSRLRDRADAVIAALLTEPNHEAAAAKAGIGLSTLQRWLRNPKFLRRYRKTRRTVLESAVGRLQQAADKAVEALERNLTCEHPPSEIRAAVAILEQATRGLELMDLRERLEQLEQLLKDTDQGDNAHEPVA